MEKLYLTSQTAQFPGGRYIIVVIVLILIIRGGGSLESMQRRMDWIVNWILKKLK
jgi:hypothetical protein